MKKTALIMAGGRGERFWPKSRKNLPKQFLSLTNDGKTMIQLTVKRILPLVDIDDVYIATNEAYKQLVHEQLPSLPEENILCEPVGRNTAPCIGLGAIHIHHKYEDAIMIVLPSDHLIKNNNMFTDTLTDACKIAEKGQNLVTLGITPNYPETGYGYIKAVLGSSLDNAYRVERFVEKPDLALAEQYVHSGNYYWNSGMFIWKISTILSNIDKFLPETSQGLKTISAAISTAAQDSVLKNIFPQLPSESIDYGVMEKASDIYILPGNFGWDDVGSWLAIERIKGSNSNHNTITGNVIALDTTNCTIEAANKLIATVGLDNIIIVDTEDATLICSKEKTNKIKEILEILRKQKQEYYL